MSGSDRLVELGLHVGDRLRRELPSHLAYHGPRHTLEDVVPAVNRICRGEGVEGIDRELVLAAAFFHDIGFVEAYNGNEAIGARIAAETLPGFGYSQVEIGRILGIILSTEMREIDGVFRQAPGDDLLKRILCDADLDNLGREDFMSISADLRRELLHQGKSFTELEWLGRQIVFVSQQEWFTATQRADREAGKKRNLAILRQELAKQL